MKEVFNALVDSILVCDDKDSIIFVNKAFLEFIGYKEKEMNLSIISNMVQIQNGKIEVHYNNRFIEGTYNCNVADWEGKAANIYIVKWKVDKVHCSKIGLLEKLIDEIENGVCIKTKDNEYIFANKTIAEYYGTTKDKVGEILTEKLTDSALNKDMYKYDNYVIENKSGCIYQVKKEVNGIEHYYEVKKAPIINEYGEVDHIGIVVKDITLKKNVQYRLLEDLSLLNNDKKFTELNTEETHHCIFNNMKKVFEKCWNTSNFNIWIYDKERCVLNPYFKPTENNNVLVEKEPFYISESIIQKFFDGTFDKVLRIKKNELFFNSHMKNAYVVNYPIINQGEFIGVISMSYLHYPIMKVLQNDIIKDICNQIGFIIRYVKLSKMLEDEFKKRNKLESELKTFLDLSSDFVFKTDIYGKFKEVSRGCVDVLGWTREEFLNMKWQDLIHADDLEETILFIEESKSKKERVTWINRFRAADGTYKWLRWGGGHHVDNSGYILGAAKDITLEKELELKNKMLEKTIQLDELRNEFFANLSHELRTPITLIMSVTQMIQQYMANNNLDQDQEIQFKKYTNILRQNGYRLLRLVNNLIDITKIDSGFYKINKVNCNVIYIIEEIVLSVVEYCKGKKIQLTFDTEVEEEYIACDPDQIERIILNLLSNAIKYTDNNGQINVNVYLEDNYVVVQVKDSGAGIAKEKIQIIFDRFIQGEHTFTRKCEGSGIGLSLVKALVEMHEGNILVSSQEGLGSVFEFRLPRKQISLLNSENKREKELKRSKIEKCNIEFSDIYNFS